MAYKVIILNGSPKANGCTATALDEMIRTLQEEGIETELIQIGNKEIRGCTACRYCSSHDGCVFDDIVNEQPPNLRQRMAWLLEALFITGLRTAPFSPLWTVSSTAPGFQSR